MEPSRGSVHRDAVPEARVAIRHYLLLSDSKLPNADVLIDRMRAENKSQKRAEGITLCLLSMSLKPTGWLQRPSGPLGTR